MAVILGSRSVLKRDGTLVPVENLARRSSGEYDNFNVGNAFYTLGAFDSLKFDGDLTLIEFENRYTSLKISDFEERPKSAYTSTGEFFNTHPSSASRGYTTVKVSTSVSTNPDVLTTVTVFGNRNFYDSGWLLSSTGSILYYESKFTPSVEDSVAGVPSTFDCYVVRGSNTLNIGNGLVQYSPP
jgi:hypothetical protein